MVGRREEGGGSGEIFCNLQTDTKIQPIFQPLENFPRNLNFNFGRLD